MEKEKTIFGILDAKTGEYKRLVRADGIKELRLFLLKDVSVDKPSTGTVAKLIEGGMKVEQAQ